MQRYVLISILFVLIPTLPALAQQKITRKTELTEKTYPALLKALQELPVETHWKEIPWRPNLGEAIEEARREDKPIVKKQKFTEFELVAFGSQSGGGRWSFEDPVAMGAVLALASDSPVDRVEPHHFKLYGWK